MAKKIRLSPKSQELIKQSLQADSKDVFSLPTVETKQHKDGDETSSIPQDALIKWLNLTMVVSKKAKYRLEALRLSLLKDLHNSLLKKPPENDSANTNRKRSWLKKIKFGFLAVAGTLLAFSDGFNGMVTLASMLLPAGIALGLGYLFSALSVAVYYGFDLNVISENIGIEKKRSKDLIDALIAQMNEINAFRKDIKRAARAMKNEDERESLIAMTNVLKTRHEALKEAKKTFTNAQNHPVLKVAKTVMSLTTGVLFFSSGFFMGQSLAIILAGIFAASMAAFAWPATVLGVVMGLAAFGNYWFLERPGLENLVGKWVGLDKEKIDEFCDEAKTTEQDTKLNELDEMLKKPKPADTPKKEASMVEDNKPAANASFNHPTKQTHGDLHAQMNSRFFSVLRPRSKSESDLGAVAYANHGAPSQPLEAQGGFDERNGNLSLCN